MYLHNAALNVSDHNILIPVCLERWFSSNLRYLLFTSCGAHNQSSEVLLALKSDFKTWTDANLV